MLRLAGATRRQVLRMLRIEALSVLLIAARSVPASHSPYSPPSARHDRQRCAERHADRCTDGGGAGGGGRLVATALPGRAALTARPVDGHGQRVADRCCRPIPRAVRAAAGRTVGVGVGLARAFGAGTLGSGWWTASRGCLFVFQGRVVDLRTGSPAARHAWKPPVRSVARCSPNCRSETAARLDA